VREPNGSQDMKRLSNQKWGRIGRKAPSENPAFRKLAYDPLWVETVRRTLFADIVAISLSGHAFAQSSTLI
jgi:hypothetical protein